MGNEKEGRVWRGNGRRMAGVRIALEWWTGSDQYEWLLETDGVGMTRCHKG